MKTEKDDRKVEKSYLIENWLTLNKTPFSQWKTETQHKNLLLMCLEIFEEMETELRKEKIPVDTTRPLTSIVGDYIGKKYTSPQKEQLQAEADRIMSEV